MNEWMNVSNDHNVLDKDTFYLTYSFTPEFDISNQTVQIRAHDQNTYSTLDLSVFSCIFDTPHYNYKNY